MAGTAIASSSSSGGSSSSSGGGGRSGGGGGSVSYGRRRRRGGGGGGGTNMYYFGGPLFGDCMPGGGGGGGSHLHRQPPAWQPAPASGVGAAAAATTAAGSSSSSSNVPWLGRPVYFRTHARRAFSNILSRASRRHCLSPVKITCILSGNVSYKKSLSSRASIRGAANFSVRFLINPLHLHLSECTNAWTTEKSLLLGWCRRPTAGWVRVLSRATPSSIVSAPTCAPRWQTRTTWRRRRLRRSSRSSASPAAAAAAGASIHTHHKLRTLTRLCFIVHNQ